MKVLQPIPVAKLKHQRFRSVREIKTILKEPLPDFKLSIKGYIDALRYIDERTQILKSIGSSLEFQFTDNTSVRALYSKEKDATWEVYLDKLDNLTNLLVSKIQEDILSVFWGSLYKGQTGQFIVLYEGSYYLYCYYDEMLDIEGYTYSKACVCLNTKTNQIVFLPKLQMPWNIDTVWESVDINSLGDSLLDWSKKSGLNLF